MSKISCIIVEDEPLAVKVLSDYIAQVPFLDLKSTFKDAILATEYLRDNSVDLIFLDIHLPKLKGMAFLKTLTIHLYHLRSIRFNLIHRNNKRPMNALKKFGRQ